MATKIAIKNQILTSWKTNKRNIKNIKMWFLSTFVSVLFLKIEFNL